MKYKVLPSCPLWNKLTELKIEISRVNKMALNLAESMGFKTIRKRRHVLAGGISSFYREGPKPEGFKLAYGYDYGNKFDFYPKSIKVNSEIIKKIEALPVVTYDQLNDLVNYDPRSLMVGNKMFYVPEITFKPNLILIGLHEDQEGYRPVKGMIEITVSEYKKLTKTRK